MNSIKNFWRNWWLILTLGLIYILTHFYNLTALPVFADESIYIRWAQLIIDNWRVYLFFPLNDGKTPLFIWLLVPFQSLTVDQLWNSRVLAVIVGGIQCISIGYLTHLLGGRFKTSLVAATLTMILPFWYTYHRLALIDGLLAVWLTMCVIGLVKMTQKAPFKKWFELIELWPWIALTGISFGLALLTKVPAILAAPIFPLFILLPKQNTGKTRHVLFMAFAMTGVIGLGMFGLLKLAPAFSQLFARGSDFLYPWREVIFDGKWRQTLPNILTYINYFWQYATWPVVVLAIIGLFSKSNQRTFHILFWSAVIFCAPIVLLGKVVYPRYFLPAMIFLTVASALELQNIIDHYVTKPLHLGKKLLGVTVIVFFVANTLGISLLFMSYSALDANKTPFVSADKTQFLYEWSSGHGIVETVEFIQTQAKSQKVAVATEGTFGTLPDAILLYLHHQDVSSIYIEGIGQPVRFIPENFTTKAQNSDLILLVVNSHRLDMKLAPDKLLKEYCRPDQAPCLQIWDITDQVKP